VEAKPLQVTEHLLIGAWVAGADGVSADETCIRIENLVRNQLEHVADHPHNGAWETLFRDPRDGRFWERTYPQGNVHGGGPPALRVIPRLEARAKYQLNDAA
jgi:hypothetical protein